MKKSYLFLASAAMILAGCADNDYLGDNRGTQGNGAIEFSTKRMQTTRATSVGQSAAEKLGNQFIVFGEKFSAAEGAAAGQTVFPNYVVKYDAGTAYTTESNTHNWEYVGDWANYSSGNVDAIEGNQTIKYWDYSAQGYTFHAFSASQYDLDNNLIVVDKTLTGTDPADKYGKGWSIGLKPGASLGDLYIANREEITTNRNTNPSHEPDYATDGTDANKFGNYVNLTFRAAVAKVRFAMYETVPGYNVKIDKVYCENAWDQYSSTTNFAIDCDYHDIAGSGTTMNVVYYNATDVPAKENQPKVTVSGAGAANYAVFGPKIHEAANLGYTSNTATYEQEGNAYTYVLPNPDNTKDMVLRVDYTLTSTDGTDETIKVKHASAVVPFPYAKWESNYAYTYIFKISNNTNGTTGNPDDPNPDPVGLYPITFDACVVDVITDVQETITTVADPSITTYAQGVVVTENDEYVADKPVYVAVQEGTTNTTAATTLVYGLGGGKNAMLYRVYNHGTETITEETVANWDRNYMTLVEITEGNGETEKPKVVTTVPGANNTTLTMSALKFTPKAGETYAFRFKDASGKVFWKVIKIDGTTATVTYDVTGPTAIANLNDVASITVKEATTNYKVLGAKNLFYVKDGNGSITNLDVTESDNVYSFAFSDNAKLNGLASTAHTVTFKGNNTDYAIGSIAYAVDNASVSLIAGASQVVTVTAGSTPVALADAPITDPNDLVTATTTDTDGKFTIATTDQTPAGVYTVKVADKTVTVTVTNYVFAATSATIEHDVDNANIVNLTLQKKVGNAAAVDATDVLSSALTDDATNKLTIGGTVPTFTFTPVAATDGGNHVITYKGAKATIYVKNYTIDAPATPSVKVSSGSFTATVNVNGKKIAPAKSSWIIKKGSAGFATDVVKTSEFNITINANNVTTFSAHGAAAGTDYTAYYVVGGKVMKSFTFSVVAD